MTVGTNETQGSQLSAMFDGELPAAECELLARRLGRDGQLKAQWSRYALIGAAIRGEPAQSASAPRGRAQPLAVADRVALALGGITPNNVPSDAQPVRRSFGDWLQRAAQPLAGAALVAGVAVFSVWWLQGRVADNQGTLTAQAGVSPGEEVVLGAVDLPQARADLAPLVAASSPAAGSAAAPPRGGSGEPSSYTVPVPSASSASALASAQLANYVVAHSEYAAPLNRRSVLSALIAGEAAEPAAADAAARDAAAPNAAAEVRR